MRRVPPAAPAVLMIVGSCTSLQFGAAIATPLFAHLGPGLATAARLLFAGVLLLAIARPRFWRWPRGGMRAVALFGVVMAGMNGCFYAAIDRIPLGTAVTIEFIGPLVLAAVLSRRWRDLAWVLLAAGAIAVLGLQGETAGAAPLDPFGIAFALAAGAFWAFYILAGKKVGQTVPGQGPLAVAVVVGSLVVLPFGIGSVGALVAQPVLLLPLLAVALLSSLIPYSLEFAALRRLSPRVFGVLLSLEPVVAGIAGWLLLGQGITWIGAGAMAVVVAASIASTTAPTGEVVPADPPLKAADTAEVGPVDRDTAGDAARDAQPISETARAITNASSTNPENDSRAINSLAR